MGRFRVDFYCAEARLIVELDGEQHVASADQKRDAELSKLDLMVYRIPNTSFFGMDGSTEDHINQIRLLCINRSGRDPLT